MRIFFQKIIFFNKIVNFNMSVDHLQQATPTKSWHGTPPRVKFERQILQELCLQIIIGGKNKKTMNTLKALKIVKVTTKDANGKPLTAKDGRLYKTIQFVILTVIGGLTIEGNKILARNVWEKGPEQKDAEGKGIGIFSKGDHLFNTAAAGVLALGRYVRKNTTPYVIREGQAPVNSYATIVLEEEDEMSVFKRAGETSGFELLSEAPSASAVEALVAAGDDMP